MAIERPIAVISGIIILILFGGIALLRIPIQLTPDVNKPIVSVETFWPGSAPVEIEREIVSRQEEILSGLEGVKEITSRSYSDRAEIELEFGVGYDINQALFFVSNRLNQVSNYPAESDRPTLGTSGSEDNPIAWFVVRLTKDTGRPIWTYGDFIDDVVREVLERVPGVSKINVFGGVEQEMQIIIEAERMAQYGLTVSQVVNTLRLANVSVTAGSVDESKRRYVVRTEGGFESIEQIRSVVLQGATNAVHAQVTVADIADVQLGYKRENARISHFGEAVIAFNAVRQTGANVIETMAGIRTVVKMLNEEILPYQGLQLELVYDETVYIDSAIQLVQSNIFIGGSLAALILFLFLRSLQATFIVSIAIPVSVVGTFVAMAFFGRSLNVISLAGIAFAVGMAVDAAIVVLDNIERLRRSGLPAWDAAYQGTLQVWGAILVSVLTTVMAFIPILTTDLEVGQLFRDIAVAISVAVLLSFLIAMTLISSLSSRLFKAESFQASKGRMKIPGVDVLGRLMAHFFLAQTRLLTRFRLLGLCIVGLITTMALTVTYLFLPSLEYLPEGDRNFVFGFIVPPPGYNLDTNQQIVQRIEQDVRPYWNIPTEGDEDKTTGQEAQSEALRIKHFFSVALVGGFNFIGAVAADARRAADLIPLLTRPIFSDPGTFGFVTQPSIFGRGIGGARTINLDVLGSRLEDILDVAIQATGLISQAMPRHLGHQFRPVPGLELGAPEVRLIPDQVRLADSGVSAREFADTLDALNDGLRVAEITVDGKRMDLTLKGQPDHILQTQEIGTLPVVTSSGTIIPVQALADLQLTSGPLEILHKNKVRSITLEVRPAPYMSLEEGLNLLQKQVVDVLQQQGLSQGVRLELSGTADQLTETWNVLLADLLLAIVIVYLVMAVLFESFWYPLIILFSVPVAAAGGVVGLVILNLYYIQPLDMLTMLGFIILIGIVVNNAILLVDRGLYFVRKENYGIQEAILEATRNRIRPIFMSTLTSLFGMMPLVLFPGAGSELYRGLGSVVVGGLFLSSFLTLTLIPSLLGAFMPFLEKKPITA